MVTACAIPSVVVMRGRVKQTTFQGRIDDVVGGIDIKKLMGIKLLNIF